MSRSDSSWRKTLVQLGLLRERAKNGQRKPRQLRIEPLMERRMLAADLQLDVNADEDVTPCDALVVANAINNPGEAAMDLVVDVNRDRVLKN